MSPFDWAFLLAYLAAMLLVGAAFARRQKSLSDYFLGARRVPVWAAAVSIVATSVSAVTFLGAPEDAYTGNLTYLALNLSALIAVIVVALFFVPAFYRHNVASIYELIGHRLGAGAQRAASAAFMVGRLFASGARLFVAAIPFSLLVFNDLAPAHLYAAILLVTIIAALYTTLGGIRAVVWTEVPQAFLFLAAAIVAIAVLLHRIPLSSADLLSTLADARAADGSSKLTLLDTRTDPRLPFSLWSALTGFVLFNMAVYGADHDLTQRMLTCKNAVRGAWSAVLSNLIGLVVALLFLAIGLLLYVFYQRPDLMGPAAPAAAPSDTRQVFLSFILNEIPAGLRGLMLAGVFAAAMSSLASSLSAMASTLVCDFYKPLRPRRDERHYLRASRAAVLLWAVLLAAFASLCVSWQASSGVNILNFAIGVMIFAYTGLLAVFLTALFTSRGNALSAAAAILAGFASVAFLKFAPSSESLTALFPPLASLKLSLGWQMLIGTALAFAVCISRPRSHRPAEPPA